MTSESEESEEENPAGVATVTEMNVWYDKKLTHPCLLKDHTHEISQCKTFFSLKSFDRKKMLSGKSCWTCFQPREICKKNLLPEMPKTACSYVKKMSEKLICKECHEITIVKVMHHSICSRVPWKVTKRPPFEMWRKKYGSGCRNLKRETYFRKFKIRSPTPNQWNPEKRQANHRKPDQ